MLSIIVLNYNRLEYTKQTVENLIAKTKVPHEFIFVDNGSVDGTRAYLKGLKNKTNASKVRYVFNKHNHGVAGGRNSGLRIAQGNYLMTIDDDILVPDEYDEHLVNVCDNVSNLGITGICVEKPKRTSLKIVDDVSVRYKNGNLGGGCLCMPRSTFDRVGYFRPDFVYGIEDVDMYIRLKTIGLKSFYIVPMGKHIDKRENITYASLKRAVHRKKSKAFAKIGNNELTYKKTGQVYIPYMVPNFDTKLFDNAIRRGAKKK